MVYDPYMHELTRRKDQFDSKMFLPSPGLNKFVHRYFVLTGENRLSTGNKSYILPDNSAHLIFYLFDRGSTIEPKWNIIGPRSKHKVINRKNRLFTFACSFRPGGLSPFVRLPMSQLVDQSCAASELFATESRIFDDLAEAALAGNIQKFIDYLEAFLTSSFSEERQIHQAVESLYHHYLGKPNHLGLNVASKHLGYSERHLRNLIKHHIGHSPKTVDQLERFSLSLRKWQITTDWADIAYSSGYYDQSHMIADYQKLIGSSPDRLFS